MRKIAIAILVALSLALTGCGGNYSSRHTSMQTGMATYNPAPRDLHAALLHAGWPEAEIAMGSGKNYDFYNAVLTDHVGDKTCTIDAKYYGGNPPTYIVVNIAGVPVTGWHNANPADFNQPGIKREVFNEHLASALRSGAITC